MEGVGIQGIRRGTKMPEVEVQVDRVVGRHRTHCSPKEEGTRKVVVGEAHP